MAEVLVKTVVDVLLAAITKENIRLINPKNLGSDVYFATFSLSDDDYEPLERERESAVNILKSAEVIVYFQDKDSKEQSMHLKVSDQKTIGVSQISQKPRLMFFHNPADLTERVTRVSFKTV